MIQKDVNKDEEKSEEGLKGKDKALLFKYVQFQKVIAYIDKRS